MKRVILVSLLVGCGWLTSPNSRAAESGTNAAPVALEALVAEVVAQNPEIQFYEAEMAAARAGQRTAGLPANPELSTTLGAKSVRGGGLNAEGVAWSVSLMQPLEWPGRLGLRKAIANRDLELAGLGAARFKAALAGRARQLAYTVISAHEKAAAFEEVAGRFKELREVLVQRDPAGLTPLLETRIIEATEVTMQHQAAEAALAAKTALLELNRLRGIAADARLELLPVTPAFQPAPAAEALLAVARTNNFELRVRAAELAQQGFRVELAKNERFPAIAVGPTVSEERAGDRERIIGLSVSVPLPFWNRNAGNIDAAKARQMQAEVSLGTARREVEQQVHAARMAYEARLREMGKWRPDSVQHFKDAAELADRHYRLGAVPVATYVELQRQYLEAMESLLDARRGALEAAVQIEQLTGLVPSLVNLETGSKP